MAKAPRSTVSADEGALLSTVRNLWDYMWPSDRPDLRMRAVLAIGALLLAKVASTLVPFAYKGIIDSLGASGPDATVLLGLSVPIVLVVAYGIGQIVDTGFQQLRDILFASVGQNAVRQLAYRTFTHVHRLSLRFHLQRKTGGLSRVIERGTKGIETIVRFTMLNTAPTLVEFVIVGVIFAWLFGIAYVLVLAAVVVLYMIFTVQASNWRIAIRRDMNESDTDANAKAIDSLLNFETVKYFGNEDLEANRFDKAMSGYERAAIRIWTSLGWLNFGQGVIFWSGMIVLSVMSALAVMRGELTVGDFVLLNTFMMQIYRPLNQIGFVYREIRQGLADIEAMFRLLDQNPEIEDKPDAGHLGISGPVLSFHDVYFHYDPDRPILRGVSFEVPAGKTIAVVGPSGAGKSTISRLIYRFYDVISGQVSIDGKDVRDVTQASLRAAIGMVPQDTVLFNDTIAYNIRYGRPDATDAEVRDAARMAQIGDFIESLPHGYETQVGERGLKLSGGEKQRVAIARTILKAPPILILDEATSALDTHTEREIQSALDTVARGRTTLVIAHRLSTVVDADEIIVLRDGVIAERGRHNDLLASNGLYAQMWNRQREAAEASERLRAAQEDPEGFVIRKPAEQPAE
ncbi:ABCB family ABC transporter ATP-binding protein/permease [Pelagibacterium halotolerans]|uniref:ABC transporter HlyB/MsbA family n=1 Tax=Pelagibacterium halotolerans (strain DSM 22347 / JCM 15775 / CGMCC 1.7692 / B2) TaxID=1082931 RepID=G4RF67_PELHB|nr:ABC transporter ATP-binding protein/permease [Pelagibacterium halotolerans]AEQ50935.1 ABC transporter HlyB/MsbA family [Pelagibacterium halotolerans B2]QJR19166.1 ABC transporter ATP-binding protein/permease [Pelagibacterium halotolerans]SEA00388.1 ATP-binding cassette, subfamily B [Pelagibacterium halotolerans]